MTTEVSTISTMFPTKMTRIGGENVQTISARTIHEYLESGQDFTNWIKARIEKYGFVSGQDFSHYKIVDGDNSSRFSSAEYEITLDMAKELGMVEGNTKGQEIRQYFIASEKEMRRLQVENTKLLEAQTKTLQIENKSLARENYDVKDRNEYLEGKKSLAIDNHELKQVQAAYEEVCEALRVYQDEICSGEWAEGTSKSSAGTLQRLAMQRMKGVLRGAKLLRKYFEKSHLAGEGTLEMYLRGIEREATYLHW